MKFFNKDKQLSPYETIEETMAYTESKDIILDIHNDTSKEVLNMRAASDIPMKINGASSLDPQEKSQIKLKLDGQDLWDYDGKSEDLIITWTERKHIGKWKNR